MRREHFDTHPPHFAERRALLLDVGVWPAEHLDDGALLALVVRGTLRHVGRLPHEVQRLKVDLPSLTLVVRALDGHRKGRRE